VISELPGYGGLGEPFGGSARFWAHDEFVNWQMSNADPKSIAELRITLSRY